MRTRDFVHLGLVIPIAIGVLVTGFLLFQSSRNTISDDAFSALAARAWSEIFTAMPAEMPGQFSEIEMGEADSDAPREEVEFFARNNAFLATCSILMLLGIAGIGVISSAQRQVEPSWNPVLRILASTGAVIFGFYLFGFMLAFPGMDGGFFGELYFSLPDATDSYDYGMLGLTEATDALYISLYAALFAALLVSFVSAGQTATSAFLVAMPTSLIGLPIAISWQWGGGWLSAQGASDFAGASLIHWQVGAVALFVGIVLRFSRRDFPIPPASRTTWLTSQPETEPDRPVLSLTRLIAWCVGIGLYLLLIVGMNAGSALESTPNLVASIIQATLLAAGTAAVLAALWRLALPSRTVFEWAGHGLIAGAIVVSGCVDELSSLEAAGLGLVAGLVIPPLIYLGDRFFTLDPLAVAGVHGVGGLLATISCVFLAEEATLLSQALLLLTSPMVSLFLTVPVLLFFGAVQFLHDKPKLVPPPVPARP